VLRPDTLDAPAAPVDRRRPDWFRQFATLLSVGVSTALLIVLYRNLDVRLIGLALLRADGFWLVVSIGMILPITVLRALRFLWVAPAGALPGVGEALRLTLVASSLNIVMPAKAGDLIKSYFIARRSDTSTGTSVAIVVYERLCDLFALITWCVLAWVVARPDAPVPAQFWLVLAVVGAACAVLIMSDRAALFMRALVARALPARKLRRLHEIADGWPDLLSRLRRRRRWIVGYSLLLWLGHLFQIWMFTVALSEEVPLTVCASLSAVALMAGQLPLTFAGLGTRDVALVVLLSRYMAPESAAAMGVLIFTRGLVPSLIGLPLLRSYLAAVGDEVRRRRGTGERG
jgi:hypothetical protein